MPPFLTEDRRRYFMFRWLVWILIIAVTGLQYRLWFGEANLREVWALQYEIQNQQTENDQLVERNHRLQAEVKDLKKGLAALEERARNDLGMVREDETFFQLIPGKTSLPDDAP
ncbi:cell division protein FtsB [Aliamphritea ceti]|uniref:cell division protein FtsB n=1 Tax=Aliamphritea ceti TaxID=1524258 RepID=UPI0035E434F4